MFHQLCSEESGQSIVEYALILALLLIVVVGAVRFVGSNSNTVFSNVSSSLQ